MTRPDRLRDHWYPRAGWRPDRRYLTWHVLPGRDPAVIESVGGVHRALGDVGGLDQVPTRWLHITVQGVGFVDELSQDGVDAMVDAARAGLADFPPLDVVLEPAQVHHEGVVMDAHPVDAFESLRQRLRGCARVACGHDAVPGADGERMWPHLSVAYANAAVASEPIRRALDRLARPDPIRTAMASVSLIALRSADHLYSWHEVAAVALSGSIGPPPPEPASNPA